MPVMDIKGVKAQNPKRMALGSLFKRKLLNFIPSSYSASSMIFTLETLETGDKTGTYPGAVESALGLYFSGHKIMPPGGHPSALAVGRIAV